MKETLVSIIVILFYVAVFCFIAYGLFQSIVWLLNRRNLKRMRKWDDVDDIYDVSKRKN